MFERLFGAVDPELAFSTFSVVNGEVPANPAERDGWIVSGSKHGVYDPLPWIDPLKGFLRRCLEEGSPVVGICFGHQLLAEATGGRAEKAAAGWGIGVQEYDVVRRPSWMADLPERFAIRAIHQDQVTEKPAGAVVLASSPFCPFAALAYGDPERPAALTLQPHPEFDAAFLDELLEARSGAVIPAEHAEAARATLDRPVHSLDWARWISCYFRRAAAPPAPVG